MKLKFLFDSKPPLNSFANVKYKVDGIPTQFVIGRNGKIVSTFVGYDSDGDPNEQALVDSINKALKAN